MVFKCLLVIIVGFKWALGQALMYFLGTTYGKVMVSSSKLDLEVEAGIVIIYFFKAILQFIICLSGNFHETNTSGIF